MDGLETMLEAWLADGSLPSNSPDAQTLKAHLNAAIEANEQAADDVRNGKMAAIGRLMGHVMKSSGGSADAKVVQAKLKELLG